MIRKNQLAVFIFEQATPTCILVSITLDTRNSMLPRNQKPASVKFSDTVQIVTIQRLSTWQIESFWYTKDEYERIRNRCLQSLSKKRSGTFKESSTNTFLGLQHLTIERKLQRNVHRRIRLIELQDELSTLRVSESARSA